MHRDSAAPGFLTNLDNVAHDFGADTYRARGPQRKILSDLGSYTLSGFDLGGVERRVQQNWNNGTVGKLLLGEKQLPSSQKSSHGERNQGPAPA
jgi:hypothetical protein